ncbi:hypothetical protein [Planctomycetes bacterium K23_9]|uniref:Uncharacterized protein n=1 Tax=Stieleria marina TaxID=1930275 RepID=A0A517NVE1_9BACT|nr:hypothetical protein K239x_30880 [Planctomycetes bacterium K23_9]
MTSSPSTSDCNGFPNSAPAPSVVLSERHRSFDDVSPARVNDPQAAGAAYDDQAFRQIDLDLGDDIYFDDVDWWSASMGLLPPALLLGLAAGLTLPLMELTYWLLLPLPGAAWTTAGMQMLLFPFVALWAVIVTVPMFWHVSILTRFAVAVALCIPTAMGLRLTLDAPSGAVASQYFGMVLTAGFLPPAVIGTTFQLWSPWSLVHRRQIESAPRPTSLRTLIELTTVTAVFLWFGTSFDYLEHATSALVVASVTAITSLMLIGFCIGRMQSRANVRAIFLAVSAGVLLSTIVTWLFLSAQTQSASFPNDGMPALIVLIFGAGVMSAWIYAATKWLERCGWRCVASR